MKSVVLIFLGGGLGSVLRYGLGRWIGTLHTHPFPLGTLVVNCVACGVLGLIIGAADHRQLISAPARLFWAIGFCGGFSTFSTFSSETLYLLQNGFTTSGLIYVMASVVLCVGLTFVGIYAGENL